ncbi:hypothetical protein CcCBS67573_g00040 [Chytriomyces confervae]|uniref:Uncharacterized protein n=1 Tax=Chytriomyces confervae TaxID=246404 RepID=A0A507FR07_9FUNG|nr:hypothetical protein CcCBS67573_g00040 [Chytriomyces confervae]
MNLGPIAAIARPRAAPSSVYLKGIGAGFVCGFGLETMLIKTGYYNIILKGEAKQIIKQQRAQVETPETAASS